MKKSLLLVTLTILLSNSSLVAYDTYKLEYTEDKNCTLIKNGKDTALFDKRFEKKKPHNPYTCFAIQKEQYNECRIIKKKNIKALVFSYGSYDYTNLLMAIQSPTKHTDAFLEVKCRKSIK